MVNRNFIWRATLIAVFFILACGFLFTSVPVLADTTSTPTSTPQTPTSTQTYNCYDSDGGVDYGIQGSIQGYKYKGDNVPAYYYDVEDSCTGETSLYEYFCYEKGDVISQYSNLNSDVPEGSEYVEWFGYDCATEGENMFCYSGVCMSTTTPVTCYDTDGNDLMAQGEIQLSNGVVYKDACFPNEDPTKVFEGTCLDAEWGHKFDFVQCPDNNFCQDGACVSTSTQQNIDLSFSYISLGYDWLNFEVVNLTDADIDPTTFLTSARKIRCADQEGVPCFEVGLPYYFNAYNYYSSYTEGPMQGKAFTFESSGVTSFNDWLTQHATTWDHIKLTLNPSILEIPGGWANNILYATPIDPDQNIEDLIEDEEQDSAEDLAGEIASLDDDIDYYYGYGYYGVENTEGNTMGYGYYPIYPQGYGYYGDEQESDFYGYGYYAGSSGSGGGGYGYGYGYNYGDQAYKSGKIDKVLNPRILPGSPFYIFKLAGKGVRSWLTFDKEEKAKLRMRYAAEKMLEANKLIDNGKEETAAKHMSRYRKDVEKLQKTLTKLEEDDQEKARRLAAVAMRLRLKEQVLLGKVEREAPTDRLERVKEARKVALENIKASAEVVEDPREVKKVFELALSVSKSPMNSVRNLEILEAVEQTGTTETTGEVVRDLRDLYSDRLERQATELVERDSRLLSDYVERAGGDEVNYLRVLGNLEERVVGEEVREEIESSRERITDRIENRIEEVRESDREEAVREILGNISDEREEDIRIIREVESRIDPELSASVREVRQELEQEVEERREEEGLPIASTVEEVVVESYSCPTDFVEQDSYTRDCGSRPENTVCIAYTDGFVWLVEDAMSAWATDGERIQIGKGLNAEYHHLLGTDCVKTARVGTTAEVTEEDVLTEEDDKVITLEEQEEARRDGTVESSEDTIQRETDERAVETETREEVTGDVEETTTETSRTEERVEEVVEVREVEIETRAEEEVRCTEDTWECGDWSDCSERGEQTRTCRMSYDCEYVRSATPTQTQSCTPRCTEDTWECGDWSECSESGTQDRTCRLSSDCEYVSDPSPDTRQSCTPRCAEDTWDCTDWSDCSERGEQTRTCRLSDDCEYDRSVAPDEAQSCTPRETEPEEVVTRNPDLTVTSLTYDPVSITDGDSVTFYATINNQAEGDASASTAYLYVDGRVQGSLSTRTIVSGANQSLTWSSVWTATVGDHTVQVCADALDVLDETDETNNCSSVRITVAEAVRGGRVSLGVDLWEDFVSFFVPVTRAFKFGSEVLNSN